MVTADLNNDGNQDIVVLNTGLPFDFRNSVSVLLGNGDGTFQNAITTNNLLTGSQGLNAIAVGDFNGDGNLDLAIANRLNNVVEVLQGNGDGTFQPNPLLLPAPGAGSVVVADFLHNGKLGLAVSDTRTNTVSVFLGNGDGTFQPAQDIATGIPQSLAAADLGDGQVDLVVGNEVPPRPGPFNVTVFQGNGDGTFRQGQTFDLAQRPVGLRVGDFNGDGNPDVIVEQLFSSDGTVVSESVLLGNGDGTFQAPISQVLGQSLSDLAVADYNGDGKLDFATGGFDLTGTVHVFPGNGDGTFGSPGVFQSGRGGNVGVAAGDFNGDGRPDLVAANLSGNIVGVLLNTSTAATATTLSTDVNPAVVGQLVNLTATVTGPAGVPTGDVTFLDGDTVLGTATLDDTGTATLAVAFATEGDHVLTAVYGGSNAFDASTSDVLTETVAPDPTAVGLTPSVEQGMAGVPVTFTVTVSPVAPGAGTPTGTVTIFDGTAVLGTARLDANGQAVFAFAFDAGGHSLTVSYGGDGNFLPGMSDPLNLPVI
jgi:hypothetical protein